MPLTLPTWLDDNFFRVCLQDGDETKAIQVTRIDPTSVLSPGSHFSSCIWRVNIKYKTDSREEVHHSSLIVKAPLLDGPFKELFKDSLLIEPTFYSEFLPIANTISSNFVFAPKFYSSAVTNVIVLEDLKINGYSMVDRWKLLNFDHCRLYVIASATFHAVSVAVYKKQPELVERLGREKLFSNDQQSASLKNFMINGLNVFADRMKGVSGYKKYSYLISPSIIWDLLIEVHKKIKSLNTLHHGDPWITNMMFKYDSSRKVTEIRLLDFQALRYSSPINDLVFFIWTCANHDVRENKLEDLYHLYHDVLNSKLQEFNCPEKISYGDFSKNVRDLSPLALILTAANYPILTNKKAADMNSLASVECENSNSSLNKHFCEYYNKHYCDHDLPRLLKQLESKGIFEYLETIQRNVQ